jgi:hypothetical protein
MKAKLVAIIFFAGAWFIAPIFIGRVFIGADWKSVGIAYAIWIALLVAFGLMTLLGGSSSGEAFTWPLIYSMFLTILAVPILLMILRWTGLR